MKISSSSGISYKSSKNFHKTHFVQQKSSVDINGAFCKTFLFRKKTLLFRKKAKPTLFRKRAPLISIDHFAKLFYSEKKRCCSEKK